MQAKLYNAQSAELSAKGFALRLFSLGCLSLCMICLGCNPKSEEQTQDDAEQSEAQEEENTSPTESESDKTVEEKSESADKNNASVNSTNKPKAESSNSSESAANSGAHSASPSTSNKNSGSAGNSATTESSAGYSVATSLRNRAASYEKKGDSKSAYQTTLAAWEAVRNAKNDKKSQQLSTQLLQDMEKYGEGLKTPVIQNVLQKPVRYE